jgi:hypothetical protein
MQSRFVVMADCSESIVIPSYTDAQRTGFLCGTSHEHTEHVACCYGPRSGTNQNKT